MSVGDRVFQVAPWMVFPHPITAQATTETHWNGLKRSEEKKSSRNTAATQPRRSVPNFTTLIEIAGANFSESAI